MSAGALRARGVAPLAPPSAAAAAALPLRGVTPLAPPRRRQRCVAARAKTTSSRSKTASSRDDRQQQQKQQQQKQQRATPADPGPLRWLDELGRRASFLVPKQEGDVGDVLMMSLSLAVLVYLGMQLYRLYYYLLVSAGAWSTMAEMMRE